MAIGLNLAFQFEQSRHFDLISMYDSLSAMLPLLTMFYFVSAWTMNIFRLINYNLFLPPKPKTLLTATLPGEGTCVYHLW